MLRSLLLGTVLGSEQRRKSLLLGCAALGALLLCLASVGLYNFGKLVTAKVIWLYWFLGVAAVAMGYTSFAGQWHRPVASTTRRTFWLGVGCLIVGVLDTPYIVLWGSRTSSVLSILVQQTAPYWLVARFLFAVLCLVVAFLGDRPVYAAERYVGLLLTVLSGVILIYLLGRQSVSFISASDGGLASESRFQLATLLLMLVAGWQCWRRWVREQKSLDYYLLLALVFAVCAETAHLYGGMNDAYDFASRMCNFVCYAFLYYRLFVLYIKQLEEELSTAHQRLRNTQRMSLLGEVSSRLHHEMKNLLASVKGCAQLGQLSVAEPRASELFQRIVESVDDFSLLLSEVTSIGRKPNAAGAVDLVDMTKLLQRIERLWRVQTSGRNIWLQFEYAVADARIRGHSQLMRSVISNLLSNATQALETVGGGRLVVKLDVGEGGNTVLLSITDTGPGIPEDVRRRIFDPLFTTKSEGTGLGLVICKEIVEDIHNGRIWFSSEVGKGTTFFVELPRADI